MHRKAYTVVIAMLVLLIAVLLSAMAYIGFVLLTAPKDDAAMQTAPAGPTATPKLLTAEDFAPDRDVLFTIPSGTLTDDRGRAVKLSAMQGRETVLIFWSSWCGDCKEYLSGEFAQAAQSARSRGAAVHLVCREGVQGDSLKNAQSALAQLELMETTLMDPDAALYQSLGLHWVPSVAILNAQGRLMYTGKGAPDAAEMAVLLDYAKTPAEQTLHFIETRLTTPAGAVFSGYRVKNGEVVPGDTLLSESQGLLMLWAAQSGDQACFDRIWRAVRDSMSSGGLTAWRVVNGTMADVNASLDDLRIIEALMLADARWGMYGHEAAARAEALYDHCIRDGLMRDFASLKGNTTAEDVTLCYMDVSAMQAAAVYDPRWEAAAAQAKALLKAEDSLISKELPLYHTRYDAEKQVFTSDTVQMNEACVAVLNAVRAGAAFPQTLDWLENTLAVGPVYARYGADGRVLPGYEYESNATYALLVQIGAAAGRERMTQLAMERMERKRSFDAAMHGGYGEASSAEHFTFDELEAMLAWAALETRE